MFVILTVEHVRQVPRTLDKETSILYRWDQRLMLVQNAARLGSHARIPDPRIGPFVGLTNLT